MTKPADNPEKQPPTGFPRQSILSDVRAESIQTGNITQSIGDTYEAQRQVLVVDIDPIPPQRKLSSWVDRLQPQGELKAHLETNALPLVEIVAAGGFGKSQLAVWAYEQTHNQFDAALWVNCGKKPSFNSFSRWILQEIGFLLDEATPDDALAQQLVYRLIHKRCLVIIDQLEAVIPTDEWPSFQAWLTQWQRQGRHSKVIVTTRQSICEEDQVCLPLIGFTPSEGGTYLTQQGIQSTWDDGLGQLSTLAQGHPLLLNLAASWLQTTANSQLEPSGLTFFERLFQHNLDDPEAKVEQVFSVLIERLLPLRRQVLLKVSVYRQAFDLPQAQAMEPEASETDLQALENQGFLLGQENRWTLHPLVQTLVQAALQAAGQEQTAHQRAIDHFSSRLTAEIIDLNDILECFHHHCELGSYSAAYDVVEKAYHWLDLQGYYRLLTELYGHLVDGWQDHPPSSQDEQQKVADSLNSLGNAYNSLGEYRRAIDFHQQSLDIAQAIGDRRREAASLGNLGNAYDSLGEYRRAINFHQQSLDIKQAIGDRRGEAASLGSLGNAYASLGEYRRAIDFHQQHYDIAQAIGDHRGEANSLGNLGLAYFSLGEYRRAIDFHQQSLDIAQAIGDRRGEAISLFNKAMALAKLDEHWAAKEGFEQARALFAELQLAHMVEKCDQAIRDHKRSRRRRNQRLLYLVLFIVVLVLVIVIR